MSQSNADFLVATSMAYLLVGGVNLPKTNPFSKAESPHGAVEESMAYSRGLRGDFGKGSIGPTRRACPDA